MGVPPVSGSGSWAMAMTFRERTLEEEQAGSAKDRRGLALPRLSCLRGMAECAELCADAPTSLTAAAAAFVDFIPLARNF